MAFSGEVPSVSSLAAGDSEVRPASQASRSLRGESFSALNEDSLPNTNSIAPEEDSLRDPAGNAEGAEEEDEEELDGEAYAWFEEIASRVQVEDFSFIDYETVPCTPLVDIPGLAFLSPNAEEELAKNLRPDVVSEGL